MNYFKAAEEVLSSVPTLEQALENLKGRRQRLIARGKPRVPGAIDYSKPFINTHFLSDALNELLAVSECERNIAKTNEELAEIRSVMDQLADEHKKILILWYIERQPKEAVLKAMHVESLTTIYNLRNKAVAEFALHYYGAAALASV